MIDVHTHILPFVDDGAKDMESALSMLRDEEANEVSDVFLTPHYMPFRHYTSTYRENKEVFDRLFAVKEKAGISVNIHLGNEIYYSLDALHLLQNGTLVPLGASDKVLIEFSMDRMEEDPAEAVHNIKAAGFTPIIAHVERYPYLNHFHDLPILRKMGALIQVNASPIIGKSKHGNHKLVMKLIKKGIVDIVASDVHAFRTNHMLEASRYVGKKFGADMRERLFSNPSF